MCVCSHEHNGYTVSVVIQCCIHRPWVCPCLCASYFTGFDAYVCFVETMDLLQHLAASYRGATVFRKPDLCTRRCWGSNSNYQLGINVTGNVLLPPSSDLPGLYGVTQVHRACLTAVSRYTRYDSHLLTGGYRTSAHVRHYEHDRVQMLGLQRPRRMRLVQAVSCLCPTTLFNSDIRTPPGQATAMQMRRTLLCPPHSTPLWDSSLDSEGTLLPRVYCNSMKFAL